MTCDSCACDFVDSLASRGPSHRYDKQEHWIYFDESVKKELSTNDKRFCLFLSSEKCFFETTPKNIAVNEDARKVIEDGNYFSIT